MQSNLQSNSGHNRNADEGNSHISRKEFLADAGRSILGLLSFPAVAAISGCGLKKEPLQVPLSDLLASPEKYDGVLITTQGYAKSGEQKEERNVNRWWDHTTRFMHTSISTAIHKYHKLSVSEESQDNALTTYELLVFSGTPGDIFAKRSVANETGHVIVTGSIGARRDAPGFVLNVQSMKRVENDK